MKDSTRKRLDAIIAMVEGPIEDPDTISMDPEQHINDLHQIRSICKNALHEDPVQEYASLLTVRNNLYEALPTGNIDPFELIKVINTHIQKLDIILEASK